MKTILNHNEEIINKINEKINKQLENEISKDLKPNKDKVFASENQLKILKKLASSIKTRLDVKQRAEIIINLLNSSIKECTNKLPYNQKTIEKWLIRWAQNEEILNRVEEYEPHKLKQAIISTLSDKNRSGKPRKLKSEQIATIIFLSLQKPEKYGVPFSNWTAEQLKKTAVKLEIIRENDISERQINRYLSEMDINLHAYEQWLNSVESNPDIEKYKARVKKNM